MYTPFEPLPPLALLPREQWTLRPLNDRQVGVGIFSRGGALYLQKWSIDDFPNDFFGIKDLERCGVLLVYMAAVEKLKDGRAGSALDPALERPGLNHRRPQHHGVAPPVIPFGRKALDFFHTILRTRFPRKRR